MSDDNVFAVFFNHYEFCSITGGIIGTKKELVFCADSRDEACEYAKKHSGEDQEGYFSIES